MSRGYSRSIWDVGAWPCTKEHLCGVWEVILSNIQQETGKDLRTVMPLRMGFPLCTEKVENRVALLKGYGNAIVPQVAAEFTKVVMEILDNKSEA